VQGKGVDLDGFIGCERAKDGVDDIRQLAGLRVMDYEDLCHRLLEGSVNLLLNEMSVATEIAKKAERFASTLVRHSSCPSW
jgi:hypothetical protein